MTKKRSGRGGLRNPPGGRPPSEIERKKMQIYLDPASRQLAKEIAEALGLSGWGRAVEVALRRMVDEDEELKQLIDF